MAVLRLILLALFAAGIGGGAAADGLPERLELEYDLARGSRLAGWFSRAVGRPLGERLDAWLLRRFPVFGVMGDGSYRLQPIYVDDMARLAVAQGRNAENALVDAIGPETFTYRELVEAIGAIIGVRRRIVTISPATGYLFGVAIGRMVGDVLITRQEIEGLMAGLLHVNAAPAGTTRLTDWARENAGTLGLRYASELARRRPRATAGRISSPG